MEKMSERPLIRCFLAGKAPGGQISDYLAALSPFNSSVSSVGPDEADFVLVSHHPKSIREALAIPERGQIRIFIGSEAIFPDMNLFDFAISFDSSLSGERVFRPHTVVRFEKELQYGSLDSSQHISIEDFLKRPFFCDFIYSNGLAHPMREKIYTDFSRRFPGVNSFGGRLKNIDLSDLGLSSTQFNGDWRAEKIAIHQHHRFSLALENARFAGYTSEKILTALMGGSIPIYWGNPVIPEEFNPKRFVNISDLSLAEAGDYVSELVESESRMREMLAEPALTSQQALLLAENKVELYAWFERFFHESRDSLHRRPAGTFPGWHSGMISKAYSRQRFSLARLASFIRGYFLPPRG
jgi:hypothetical protein